MIKGIFNFIFIWLLFLSSLGFTLYTLQRPHFLVNQARDVRLYERLTGNIGSVLPKESKENLPFTDNELKEIITASVDADTFYNFADAATTAYGDYLTSRSSTINFSYNLVPTKEKTTAALTAKMVTKYNDLPECKSNQLKAWQATSGLPECRLPSSNVQSNDVERLFARQAGEVTSSWPDSFALPAPTPELEQTRAHVSQVLRWIFITWAATLAFLLLYLLIFRARGFLSLAVIFLLAGLLEIGFSLIGWEWLAKNLIDLIGGSSQSLAGFTIDLAEAVAEVLKTIMGNLSIVSLSLGGGFLIVGLISRFRKRAEALTPGQ